MLSNKLFRWMCIWIKAGCFEAMARELRAILRLASQAWIYLAARAWGGGTLLCRLQLAGLCYNYARGSFPQMLSTGSKAMWSGALVSSSRRRNNHPRRPPGSCENSNTSTGWKPGCGNSRPLSRPRLNNSTAALKRGGVVSRLSRRTCRSGRFCHTETELLPTWRNWQTR